MKEKKEKKKKITIVAIRDAHDTGPERYRSGKKQLKNWRVRTTINHW